MTGNQPVAAEDQALLAFLDAQREAVLAIVKGLDEEAWHRPVVPSGWTPAGMVEHLGTAERHWFQGVVADSNEELPWDEGLPPYDPAAAFVIDRPSSQIVGYYPGPMRPIECDIGGHAAVGAAMRQARRPRDG